MQLVCRHVILSEAEESPEARLCLIFAPSEEILRHYVPQNDMLIAQVAIIWGRRSAPRPQGVSPRGTQIWVDFDLQLQLLFELFSNFSGHSRHSRQLFKAGLANSLQRTELSEQCFTTFRTNALDVV